LDHVTKLLREQLDRATSANQSLSSDVAQLSALRDEFDAREADFKREEQVAFFTSTEYNLFILI